MDANGILTLLSAHLLLIEAGPCLVLALGLALGLARLHRLAKARAARAEAANETLRDELWRLKEGAAARERAEASSEAKSRFLATMSHEIRTPLSGILGMADLLREARLDGENASYVEAIRSSGSALVSLIDQILDFSKIEAGRLDLVCEPFDLHRLVEGIVELLAPRAQSKGLEIAASIAADVPVRVLGDGLRLRQVLTNLAGNAVKFTASGGIGVSVQRVEGARLLFEVVDTGPGVAPDRRAAIFEDFEQGDGSNARHHEGAGLGLAISKRIVSLMGGDLTLTDNEGGGAVFSFVISLSEDLASRPVVAAGDPASPKLIGRRALIIAHSPFEAPAMAARLNEAGAAVSRAEGLEEGLRALSHEPQPDVVIVDCALGVEATNRLALAARAAGAPRSLVLFSPFERRAFGQTSLHGFDGWLVKPVRARSLFERLAGEFPAPPAPVAPRAPVGATRRLARALLAEDNEINATIAQKALRRLGFDVVRAHDGLEAAALGEAAARGDAPRFEIILMDIKMPGLDGFEASRAIRGVEQKMGARAMPIIALTANVMEEDRRACLSAGIDDFLTKPVDLARLAEAIDAARRKNAPNQGARSLPLDQSAGAQSALS
jgi:signal transduction histidine kinase/CheY-like chemotaxis protein